MGRPFGQALWGLWGLLLGFGAICGATEPPPSGSPEAFSGNATSASPMTDILDIKPLQKLPFDRTFLYYILAALILAGLLLAAYGLWKKRKLQSTAGPTPVPPHVAAESALEDLGRREDLTAREFYFRLSTVLRGYIEGVFGVKALEMTTEELLPQLDRLAIDAGLVTGVKVLARHSDPIKFAGLDAGPEKMRDDLGFVRDFVRSTRPAEDHV